MHVLSIPIYSKPIEVEIRLWKPSIVNRFQPIFETIETDQAGRKSNCRALFHMLLVDLAVLLFCPFHPEEPQRTEAASPVSIGDFGEGGKEGWV